MDDESKNPVGLEERRKCAGYITECIRNMSLHLNEKSKRCRYSPHIINVSIAMYLRSKKTYDDVRESGLIQLPHPSTLIKLTSPMKVKPGLDPNIHFSIKNLLKRTNSLKSLCRKNIQKALIICVRKLFLNYMTF